MLQRLLDARSQISGVFDSYTHYADGFGKLREVWILQIRLKVGKSPGFHLQFHHSQGAVVEHHHFDREVVLRHGQDVAQAHRKTTIAAHGDNLASGIGTLGANGLGKRVRHRPVVEGAEHATTLGRLNVSGIPDVAHASVRCKDRIGRRNFTQRRCHGLRVHGRAFSHVVNVHIHLSNLLFVFADHGL